MNPTTTSVIESLLNIRGRFRTLQHIAPVTDSNGIPRFYFSADSACFEITSNAERCLLRIPMGRNERQRIIATHDALRTALSKGRIARCEYLYNELTTFDAHDRPLRTDVILEHIPETAISIHSFLRMNLDRTGAGKIRSLLVSMEDTHHFLCEFPICHGRIKTENLLVSDDGSLILTDFLHTSDRIPENDRFSLLYIAILVFITSCEPSMHNQIWHIRHNERQKLLNNTLLQAEFSRDAELTGIVQLLLNPKTISDDTIATALHHIALKPFAPMPLLISLIGGDNNDAVQMNYAKDCRTSYDTGKEASTTIDFTKCDFVGSLTDTMVRYHIGNKWGFADRHGNKSGEAVYCSAEDFYEGRAAVSTNGKYGLIDRDGAHIMQPVYESLEWYGEHNTAVANLDGRCKLYDRCGKELSSQSYDWIGDPNEGIFTVRRGNKYGFVLSDGKPLTDVCFDEAFSFSGGKALVSRDGQAYHIDTEGKKTKL